MIKPMLRRPATCPWCHLEKWLLPEGVCGYCSETEDYLDHLGRIERTERINKRMKALKEDAIREDRKK